MYPKKWLDTESLVLIHQGSCTLPKVCDYCTWGLKNSDKTWFIILIQGGNCPLLHYPLVLEHHRVFWQVPSYHHLEWDVGCQT